VNPVFRLKDVHFAYLNRFPALNGITLNIPSAARVALIGSNGSGKSTLLKLLDALYFPQSGSIEFEGVELTEEKLLDEEYAYSIRRKIGFLFQDPETQLFSSTVWDEICFGPLQLQWDKERIRDSAEKILEQFAIAALRDRPPHRLSIGEKKKVALASVLVVDPEVLLLDEPTASLDPRTQSVLLELLHEWSRRNKTIITSTHDLAILREICDEVFVMHEGKIVHHDAPEKVLANEALLDETNLIHIHTHKHRDVEHVHPHTHDFHAHPHDHEKKDEG
jgi:cobalt/nickel transport system ATP-binding protein